MKFLWEIKQMMPADVSKKNIEYINYNNNNKRNIKKGKENKMKMFQF